MAEPDLRCYYHPERTASGQCDRCGDLLCRDCAKDRFDEQLCPDCLSRVKPATGPSVFDEPHLQGTGFRADPTDATIEAHRAGRAASRDELVEHTVWDEPALSRELAGPTPAGDVTYAVWLEEGRAKTTTARTWLVVLGTVLAAGPFAIFGAFRGSGGTISSVLAIVVLAPVVEESMKVAISLYIVEKRPFLFGNSFQIAVCALAGGVFFACIENVLYLHVYIPEASSSLALWRWTICVAMHTGCSFIAGMGVMRTWNDLWRRRARARMSIVYPYALTAMLIHGAYNAFALTLQFGGYEF